MRPSGGRRDRRRGRLTPPLGLFLDECANIAPLPSLPQLVTDGAGQGITTMIVLQSMGQARARWGADGTAALWDGCTVKIVLGGLADTRDLEMVSRMCGDVDIEVARAQLQRSRRADPDVHRIDAWRHSPRGRCARCAGGTACSSTRSCGRSRRRCRDGGS